MLKGMIKYLDSNINTIKNITIVIMLLLGRNIDRAVVNNFETDLFIKYYQK